MQNRSLLMNQHPPEAGSSLPAHTKIPGPHLTPGLFMQASEIDLTNHGLGLGQNPT